MALKSFCDKTLHILCNVQKYVELNGASFAADIDECKLNPCDLTYGKCTNKKGTYRCDCPEGSVKINKGQTCQGELFFLPEDQHNVFNWIN